MSNARNAAVALYTLALTSPASADWQSVATSLFEALPKSKAVADAPAWWADYAVPKAYTLKSVDVTFADGVSFRCNLVTGKNKPPRVAGACRGAIGLYRAKNGCGVAVPAFARIVTAGGQAYDAAECSRLTDELRAIPGTVQGRPMTLARIEWMESEFARRWEGCLRAQDALFEARRSHHMEDECERLDADCIAWHASVRAAETELAMMREAYAVQRGGAAPAPVALAPAPRNTLIGDVVGLDVETVLEAIGAAYGECAELELAGTFEAESGPVAQAGGESAEVIENAQAFQDVALVAEQACEAAPESSDDTWAPSAETHPVIAYCLSERAWNALRDRVQDGTFPAPAGSARFGAWRLTLADAQDLQDVGSIRFAGMPRKPYTRRAAAPVASFVRLPAGAPFMAANPPSPVTMHAPSA